jgi:small-conductance mechanosensitive channel
MSKSQLVWSLALGAALLVGCEKEETKTPTPPAAPAQPQATGTGVVPGQEEMKKAAGNAADTAEKAAGEASKTAGDTAKAADDAAKGAADAAKATATDSDMAKEAQTLLDQVKTYIGEKKFDDADAALKKLEGMADKLPATISGQLPALRKSLDAAKALGGGGGELPKVPALGK